MRSLLLLPLWPILLLAGCAEFHAGDLNPLGSEITVEREMEIGAEIHKELRDSGLLIQDPILLAYINDLGQQIVSVTEPQPFIYRFNLIKEDSLNAFAVPGGYIYIHTGVLGQAGDVSELVGVLAHEVAHVRRRHIAKAREKQGATNLAAMAATVAGAIAGAPEVGFIAQGINVSMHIQHTREHEGDADIQGIGYMIEAGYDPIGMQRFFQRIDAQHRGYGGQIPPYLYTHPDVKDRIASVGVELERRKPPHGLKREDWELGSMQERMRRLMVSVPGGTGLQARAKFDRAANDPLLAEAGAAVEAGHVEQARGLLARAEANQPTDPRVYLAQADLAEASGDLDEAKRALSRAFELDPTVPLVQYRLGIVHKRLGNRTRAVFYLEQAAANFKKGSSGRERAIFEVDTITFPVLESSGIGLSFEEDAPRGFARGDRVLWWGQVDRRFQMQHPKFDVRWIDPSGEIADEGSVRLRSGRDVVVAFESAGRAAGRWTVEVQSGDSIVERRSFELSD